MKISFKHEVKPSEKLTTKELVDLILKHRQIKDIKAFLNPPSPLSISLFEFDKKYKKSFEKVIKILKLIRKNNEMIVIYTDYDADGITGGAILWETFHLLGFKVMPYVPERKKEGYGFSKIGIDNVIKEFNPSLIISVDHGITKINEIDYARKKGIKIIVTDHHLKSDTIPKADAIFHIPELSGSGVAYFFAKEIFEYRNVILGSEEAKSRRAIPESRLDSGHARSPASWRAHSLVRMTTLANNFKSDYLVLASIGTIADLVPLLGPSRPVVKYGLEAFPRIKRFGITHILKQAGIYGKKITPYEIGFIIAPRINAVGRLKHAINALRLLCTTDEKKAYELAHQIGNLNTERQDLVEKSVEEAKKMLQNVILESDEIRQLADRGTTPESKLDSGPDFAKASTGKQARMTKVPKLIILVSEHWHEGIIGLIASKMAEEFFRPTIVLTKTDGHYKGSARSIPSFHITNFLRSLKKYLVDVGGHAAAAGFTIEENQLDSFVTAVSNRSSKLIKDKDLERVITADIKIPVSNISFELVKSLESLEPFGMGNPRPTFLSEGILADAKLFGKENNHLKLWINDSHLTPNTYHLTSLELIAFNKGKLFDQLSRGQKVDIVYNLEIDRWNGRERLRGKVNYLENLQR